MNKQEIEFLLTKNGYIDSNKRKLMTCSEEELFCIYYGLNIDNSIYKFVNFKKGYSNILKNPHEVLKTKKGIKAHKDILINQNGELNRNYTKFITFSTEELFILLKGNIKYCICGSKCTFINFKKGYKDNCGKNSCISVYTKIVEKGRKTKLDRYNDENYNNRDKHKRTCLKRYGVAHYNQNEKQVDKIYQTNIKSGFWRDRSTLDDWDYYRVLVRKLTERTYKKHKEEIDPDNMREHLVYDLDHIISVRKGFDNNIPIHIISGKNNLQILDSIENRKKFIN